MSAGRARRAGAWAALALMLAGSPARAHENHTHGPAAGEAAAPQGVRIRLADTTLVDQDGRKHKLKSELIGERLAVVSFVYTSCTTVCPALSATLAQLQARLGARLGPEVALLSITVDPVRDTPARLKEQGVRLGAGPGWSWLTGAKPQVDEVLRLFGAYTPNFADHPPLVLVGDAKSGRWLRHYGFPAPDQLLAALDTLAAERAAAR